MTTTVYNLTILDANFEAVVDHDYTSLYRALQTIAHHQDTRGYGMFYITVGTTGLHILEGKTHSYPPGKHATLTIAKVAVDGEIAAEVTTADPKSPAAQVDGRNAGDAAGESPVTTLTITNTGTAPAAVTFHDSTNLTLNPGDSVDMPAGDIYPTTLRAWHGRKTLTDWNQPGARKLTEQR